MSGLSGLALTLVATVVGADMHTAAKVDLYTVPSGKVFYPVMTVIRDPSDSMAGGTDYDLGTGADADTWRQAVDLSSMVVADTDFMAVRGADVTKYTECAAADVFGIKVITGTTADPCTAAIDLFGYLVDA